MLGGRVIPFGNLPEREMLGEVDRFVDTTVDKPFELAPYRAFFFIAEVSDDVLLRKQIR